jgi:hypothetical protein
MYADSDDPATTFAGEALRSLTPDCDWCVIRADGEVACTLYDSEVQTLPGPPGGLDWERVASTEGMVVLTDSTSGWWLADVWMTSSYDSVLDEAIATDRLEFSWDRHSIAWMEADRSGYSGTTEGATDDCDLSGPLDDIDAGYLRVCLVRDGELSCCGEEEYADIAYPDLPNGDYVAVDADWIGTTCGQHADGSLTCWGRSFGGGVQQIEGPFTEFVLAGTGVCGIRDDGHIVCAGFEGRAYLDVP